MNDTDPFARLGLQPRFDIDPVEVRRKVTRAAARLHPDRAADPVTAAEQATELAAINQAAGDLLDDIARAELLVELHGGPGPAEDRSLPEGFLESMLATRLELEEAVAAGDDAGRANLEAWARNEWAERRAAVAALLDGEPKPSPERLGAARLELNRWRYSQRMLEQIGSPAPSTGL